MATINDVAKRAGVSRSTVSLVLNKSPLVKDATRLLVEEVIREMNYVPNSNARGLSAKVTNNIGVIFMQDYLLGVPGQIAVFLWFRLFTKEKENGYQLDGSPNRGSGGIGHQIPR